jgi:hypothetical protein
MADFYPVLARAVAALPVNTPETRRSIYERARGALLGQLQSLQPPLPEADIARQSDALTLAAARIEAEHEAAARPVAEPVIADAPPMPPLPAAPMPSTDEGLVAGAGLEPSPADMPDRAGHDDVAAFEPEPSPEPLPEPVPVRPRVVAPPKTVDKSGRNRTIIVGGIVGLTVLGIAILSYVVNSGPPQVIAPRTLQPAEQGAMPDASGGKLGERVGQEAAPVTRPSRPELPVAQRAVLYVENSDDPQKPVTVGGRVAWRLDSESVGQGRPVETVARATVDIPESGLNMVFTIRRNTDAAFPASHILGMRFSRTSDDGNGAVKEAGVPQFKADESERGAPLSAITSSLGDNLFVSALSNVPIEVDRNIDLMTRRNWIDIPVRFASGKRGIIAFEKGFSGDQTITDAFNRWR